PAIVQGLGAEPGEPLVGSTVVAPFINQSTTCPVVGLYQRISPKPSPLKSPVPATVHGFGAEPGEPLVGSTVVPLSNQITTCPLVPLRQGRSLRRPALKSRCPRIARGPAAKPGEPLVGSTVTPLSCHSTTCPVLVLYQTRSLMPSPLKSCAAALMNGHAAPASPLSAGPPNMAVLPSPDSATELPSLAAPTAPLPTSLFPF